MKKIMFACSLMLITGWLFAQDQTIKGLQTESGRVIAKNPNDTTKKIWKTGGLFALTFGQTSLSNWAAGGDNLTLNLNSILSLYAFYKKGRHTWDNTLDLGLGYVKTTSLGTRKSNDKIDLYSKYGYEIAPKWYLSGLFNFRSQFTAGYDYPTDSTKDKISNFMSPANILLSAGIDYRPKDYFTIFVSPITSRWIVVTDDDLSARGAYGVDTGKHVRNEIGAFVTINYLHDIMKNVTYKARLDLFSNYRHNPQNVDLYMTNLLAMKVNKFLTANFALDLVYDDDTRIFGPNKNGARLQVRENVGVGLALKF